MAPSKMIHQGVFAVNKPTGITSAQVLRDLQTHFTPSPLFAPWLAREKARLSADSHNQKQKRRSFRKKEALQVKLGHGGTLDPMATGVLIVGAGDGTKALDRFLACTKSYECIVVFGVETDTYDVTGKIIARKSFELVKREAVEQALEKFRGKIMQRPPIYSAKSVQGKRLYEYAREGIEVPVEIKKSEVEAMELELVEWMEGGSHDYHWPSEEAGEQEKVMLEKMLQQQSEADVAGEADVADGADIMHKLDVVVEEDTAVEAEAGFTGSKRKERENDTANNETEADTAPPPKRQKSSSPPTIAPQDISTTDGTASTPSPCPAPAARLHMTVTSGFYVRSLCHDLGAAVGSAASMSSLVRTRQGDFELGVNVLEYEDLAKGEEVWEGKVRGMLEEWAKNETGKDAEEHESDVEIALDGTSDGGTRPRGEWKKKRAAKAQTSNEMRRKNSSSSDAG